MSKPMIVVFETNHETLRAESIFLNNSVLVRPVIKPGHIPSQCGMALEIEKKFEEKVVELCYSSHLSLIGIYK